MIEVGRNIADDSADAERLVRLDRAVVRTAEKGGIPFDSSDDSADTLRLAVVVRFGDDDRSAEGASGDFERGGAEGGCGFADQTADGRCVNAAAVDSAYAYFRIGTAVFHGRAVAVGDKRTDAFL